MFSRILVAVDGTATSNRGLAAAVGLAKEQGATLYILNVYDELVIAPMLGEGAMGSAEAIGSIVEGLRRAGRKIAADAQKTASKSVPNVQADAIDSRGQSVAAAILRHAKRVRADVIVLGTHGRRGFTRLVMGSDAEAVVREATVPVLLVRSPERKASRARAGAGVSRGARGAPPRPRS